MIDNVLDFNITRCIPPRPLPPLLQPQMSKKAVKHRMKIHAVQIQRIVWKYFTYAFCRKVQFTAIRRQCPESLCRLPHQCRKRHIQKAQILIQFILHKPQNFFCHLILPRLFALHLLFTQIHSAPFCLLLFSCLLPKEPPLLLSNPAAHRLPMLFLSPLFLFYPLQVPNLQKISAIPIFYFLNRSQIFSPAHSPNIFRIEGGSFQHFMEGSVVVFTWIVLITLAVDALIPYSFRFKIALTMIKTFVRDTSYIWLNAISRITL